MCLAWAIGILVKDYIYFWEISQRYTGHRLFIGIIKLLTFKSLNNEENCHLWQYDKHS